MRISTQVTGAMILLIIVVGARAEGQSPLGRASHVVVPQVNGYALTRGSPDLLLTGVKAHIDIRDRAATTTLQLALENRGGRPAEAVILLPVPTDATIVGFEFSGAGAEPTAQLLPKAEARRIYDDIVRRLRDPALLESAGYGLIRTSAFPVPPRGNLSLRIRYEQLLDGRHPRTDYVLPRSESLVSTVPWEITATIRTSDPIVSLYSPSHAFEERTISPRHRHLRVAPERREPGAFRLSVLSLEQVIRSAHQVIEGLVSDESFNVIDCSTSVARFAPRPVPATRDNVEAARLYLRNLRPAGGTNLHDALLASLRQPVTTGTLPIVLFLTDGLPTIGKRQETDISSLVDKANPHQRRAFTLGVGTDVNAPLLDRLAEASRATSSYVLPEESVEVAVADLLDHLPLGQRIESFALEVGSGDGWRKVARGTSVGHRRLLRFEPVQATRVRLRIERAAACVVLAELGLYLQPQS